jgi:hypothetical protein
MSYYLPSSQENGIHSNGNRKANYYPNRTTTSSNNGIGVIHNTTNKQSHGIAGGYGYGNARQPLAEIASQQYQALTNSNYAMGTATTSSANTAPHAHDSTNGSGGMGMAQSSSLARLTIPRTATTLASTSSMISSRSVTALPVVSLPSSAANSRSNSALGDRKDQLMSGYHNNNNNNNGSNSNGNGANYQTLFPPLANTRNSSSGSLSTATTTAWPRGIIHI